MPRGSTDSRDEVIQPATVADQLVWESLAPEVKRAVKAALYDEIEEEIGSQTCQFHDSELQANEAKIEKLEKALTDLRNLVEDTQQRSKRGWDTLVEEVNAKVKAAVDD